MYELFQRMMDTIKRMPPNLRFMIVVSAVLVIAGTALIYSWARHMTYGVLYADLPPDEVGTIVDQLEQMKIPYRLSGGGTTVSIEEGKVGEARVRLAAAGLPSGGTMGYEIFDKSTMGMTEFVQKLNYRRALEGELTRTISGLSEVAAARVHIVMPEQKLFVEDEIEPTASVVVKLRAGARLDKRKVFGIQQLVASGVEGLHADNVTILDYAGNLLSPTTGSDPIAALSARQLDLQKNVESYLQNKAQTLLDGVIGPGRSIVRVNAQLNFEQVEKTIEEYDPDNLAIVSQELNEETSTDNSTAGEGGAGNQIKKDNSITNYEVNKTVQRIVSETGNIEKLTLSVIVDGNYTPAAEEGGEPVFAPRSAEEITQLSGAVKNSVGFDDNRRDSFEMVSVQFDRDYFKDEQAELNKLEQRNFLMDIGMKVLKVAALVVAFLFLRKMWKKIVAAIKAWVPPPPPPPKSVVAIQKIEDEPAEPIEPEKRKPKLTDQMSEVAKERPEEIAKVIRTMMIE